MKISNAVVFIIVVFITALLIENHAAAKQKEIDKQEEVKQQEQITKKGKMLQFAAEVEAAAEKERQDKIAHTYRMVR